MVMKNPPHPGRSIKDACLDPMGLTVTEGARVLDVARHTLSRLINAQAGISPDMAIRLEKAFGSSADVWLRMQAAYDLAQARTHENRIDVKRYEAVWKMNMVLFCVRKEELVLLHGFIKKTRKTPDQAIAIAVKRMKG
jgi:antitoxin HigA-1